MLKEADDPIELSDTLTDDGILELISVDNKEACSSDDPDSHEVELRIQESRFELKHPDYDIAPPKASWST